MSDIIALSTYTAVRACGGPIVPIRTNRIDATKAGGVGLLPAPQSKAGTFSNQFLRWGFNNTGMVAMVACGHTLGNVHGENQPLIVDPSSVPPYAAMDSSPTVFDNKVVTEYVGNISTNPLVNGTTAIRYGRTSDKEVFGVDGGQHIRRLADPAFFQSQCQAVFQQMTEVVTSAVKLSANPLTAYDCKPYDVKLFMLDAGKTLGFSGDVRIRTTNRSGISSVQIVYSDRTGTSCPSCTITTASSGTASGFDDTFAFYGFSANISATTSISSFTVLVTHTDGSTESLANGGNGFPVQDLLLLQSPQTCLTGSALTVTAAVRTGQNAIPQLNAITKQYTNTYRPLLNTTSSILTVSNISSSGPYTFYSTTMYLNTTQIGGGTRYNLTLPGTTNSISYQDLTKVSSTCTAMATKPAPSYTSQGCVYDSPSQRTLSRDKLYGGDMTTEVCAAYCKNYLYFGTEYSQECYCGNTLPQGLANSTSCNMPCAGDSTETCGGPNGLSLYQNPVSNMLTAPPTVGNYVFQGCYTDDPAQRTLPSLRTYDQTAMTLDKCAATCSAGGYSYFGTEYAYECYCGDAISGAGTKADLYDCSMTCTGNSAQPCGNANRLTLYATGNSTATLSKKDIKHRRHLMAHLHGHT